MKKLTDIRAFYRFTSGEAVKTLHCKRILKTSKIGRKILEQKSRGQNITVDVTFTFLDIVVKKKAENRKRVLKSYSRGED